jgi:hypothetical protein
VRWSPAVYSSAHRRETPAAFNVIAAAATRLFEMGKGAKEDDGGLGVGFGELPRVTRRGAMPTVAHHRRD